VHHELFIVNVRQCVLSNCHFTSIGAMVTVSGTTTIEVSSCSFPSKFCQYPKTLPNGARLSLSNGAQASVISCSPQLSVGTGCKATLLGFDHGAPGRKTGNPITGGGGTIIDLSKVAPSHTDDLRGWWPHAVGLVAAVLASALLLLLVIELRLEQLCGNDHAID
jgi:hypothetical protein